MLDIGKLIPVCMKVLYMSSFSSMLDIGKLIHHVHKASAPESFSSMLDIGKLIHERDARGGTRCFCHCPPHGR